MKTGKIGVTTENIFPIIKKFLYSDHEIFLRELVSNSVDAIQKLKTYASSGEYKGTTDHVKVEVKVDKEKKTITVSDTGIGMTAEEIDKYINQIAFSSAEEFLEKYKNTENAIIGHFGLGFYSAFMVSERVELITKSYKDGAVAMKWECDGSPEYKLEESTKESVGTDVILHIDKDSEEWLEDGRISSLLNKYCKFLPVPIIFGKEKEWKDGKYNDTDKDHVVNSSVPLWTRKPQDLKDEDYQAFYRELYPMAEEPLFYIHLNVDYPFNLTGILYFPKIKNMMEIQKNKIQLYCRQVYVTDSVEGIVPDYLTLLHGVIDSPDIPLNVSRSYLQSDSNVKKISSHITKKVADRLQEIFKNQREEFEKKWDNLKMFITYGMITDEKFYERAEKFALLKNTDSKYFTFEEYEKLIKDNQTDKNKKLIYLYTTNKDEQYSFIENARNKGYDVLMLDGHLDSHFINHVEGKFKDSHFTRVDADIIDKLIQKEESQAAKLTDDQRSMLIPVFRVNTPAEKSYFVQFESLSETDLPVIITQSEWMRRMKEMSALSGGKSYYGEMPDSFNLVVNANHPLVLKVLANTEKEMKDEVSKLDGEIKAKEKEYEVLDKAQKEKKAEEVPQTDKDQLNQLQAQLDSLRGQKDQKLEEYGKKDALAKQIVDLALLANNMLRGEDLSKFVKRSVDLIGK